MRHVLFSLFLCGFLAAAVPEDSEWMLDYDKGMKLASSENKAILILFTGSDWCPACIRMEKEVFSQPEFKDYAARNLILVMVDFPKKYAQTTRVKKLNQELQKKYDAHSYPTLIYLFPNGKLMGSLRFDDFPFVQIRDGKGRKMATLNHETIKIRDYLTELDKLHLGN